MAKRMLCMVLDHNWSRQRYPVLQGDDQPEGTYLKCVRCGKVDEGQGLTTGPMVMGF